MSGDKETAAVFLVNATSLRGSATNPAADFRPDNDFACFAVLDGCILGTVPLARTLRSDLASRLLGEFDDG